MTAIEPARTVCVVGSGSMGAGIAQVAATAGHQTLVIDAEPARAGSAVTDIRARLRRLTEKGRLTEAEAAAASERVQPLASLTELRGEPCGLVVEAIVEDLAAKRSVFAELEDLVAEDCVLASNTSSLSITEIGARLRRPERFLGMHFFNPAPLMRLVEIVSGLATEPAVAAAVRDTAAAWGKTPVDVRATPGFLVNRIARPFYAEAFRLAEECAAEPVVIDAVLRDGGGFRMGPFELTDLIGQDVNEAVTRSVWQSYHHDPRYTPSLAQRELVAAGWLGRKSGRGMYDYAEGADKPAAPAIEPGSAPAKVIAHGESAQLGEILTRTGVTVTPADDADPALSGMAELPSGVVLAVTDGRLATVRSARLGRPVVLVDRLGDPAAGSRIAVTASDGAFPEALAEVAALLAAGGLTAHRVDDVPGLVVARTVAMLVNSAADALWQQVGGPADIDTAMRLGVNYPSGPLAWGDEWGLGSVVTLLDNLATEYGDGRYRVCPLLRRRALTGVPLHATD
ncbi:MAG TPA: 3-hydroxyacyl-CoA dehydrogenase [Pseudonocardiaceae bacterium]|jgi:3-hydroxybutyryl-CoA dehydrogenase|nr:3-hydroxyacyl-CoA dehydrogenase [Pseudonocardiaceae bacterium]